MEKDKSHPNDSIANVKRPLFPSKTINAKASGTPEKFDVKFKKINNRSRTDSEKYVIAYTPNKEAINALNAEIIDKTILFLNPCKIYKFENTS
jgi:hypothetical protein